VLVLVTVSLRLHTQRLDDQTLRISLGSPWLVPWLVLGRRAALLAPKVARRGMAGVGEQTRAWTALALSSLTQPGGVELKVRPGRQGVLVVSALLKPRGRRDLEAPRRELKRRVGGGEQGGCA